MKIKHMGLTYVSENKFIFPSLHFLKYLWIITISRVVYPSMNEDGDGVQWWTWESWGNGWS